MIKTYEKFRIVDLAGKPAVEIEVNWELNNTEMNECKVLKFNYPDGTVSYVKRELLNQLLFAIGTPEEQRKLIPQKLTKVRWYETILGVKATKDIRKGEMINFPIKISLPPIEEEVISELAKSYQIPQLLKGRMSKKVRITT